MTLHVTLLTREYVQQASDRLVTHSGGDPWEARANKSIVHVASDAVVSVGYTGLAYLGNVPTDRFIAQSLVGTDIQVTDLGARPEYEDPRRRWMDLGLATLRLHDDLRAAFTGLPPREPFDRHEVILAGWQFKRRRLPRQVLDMAWPIAWLVLRRPSGDFSLRRLRGRRWPGVPVSGEIRVPGIISTPLGVLQGIGADDIISRIFAAVPDAEATERLLAELVRYAADYYAAAGSPTIGRDVMCTTIHPPHR